MTHPERLAACSLADINDCVFRYELPIKVKRPRPSLGDGLDVSEIAKLYGGGGHKNAAGFKVGYDRLAEFLP